MSTTHGKGIIYHKGFWNEAVLTENFLRQRMFTTSGNMENMTPLDAFVRTQPDLSMLRVCGSKEFVHVPKQKRHGKLSERSVPGILVGYSPGGSYRIMISDGATSPTFHTTM